MCLSIYALRDLSNNIKDLLRDLRNLTVLTSLPQLVVRVTFICDEMAARSVGFKDLKNDLNWVLSRCSGLMGQFICSVH